MKGIKEFVELIAEDPPITMVSKLISSFNKNSSCHRRKNSELYFLVSRFQGLAAEHLMHANSSSSSQVGDVLAITLLNNSSLEECFWTQANRNIIQLAEQHARKEDKLEVLKVSKSLVENALRAVASVEISSVL